MAQLYPARANTVHASAVEPRSAAAIASVYSALVPALIDRPAPLRKFDQIHMLSADLAWHIHEVAPLLEGRRVFVMGDSDGFVTGLSHAAQLGLVPAPGHITLYDFDARVIRHAERFAHRHGLSREVSARLYNVFDPLPPDAVAAHDVFHTNPPYGRYNGGKSVIAFLDRGIAACRPGGLGIVILANDPSHRWTHAVLRSVLAAVAERRVTPSALLEGCHGYLLDDQPDLRSGLLLLRNITAAGAHPGDLPLPNCLTRRFYGRETFTVPQFIAADGSEAHA